MNIQEQNYADYLFTLSIFGAAQSWDNVLNGNPLNPIEIDYRAYYDSLSLEDTEESVYAIFSNLHDRINTSLHELYAIEFNNIGYSLDGMCQRKKAPKPH